MRWKFLLEEADTTQNVISDPVGWAEAVFVFKREKELHGIFFEYSLPLKFYSTAYHLIKDEYDTNGVEGSLVLIIQFACDDDDDFEEFYRAKLNFTKIKFDESENCLVELPIEDDTDLSLFKNRQDQEVDMDSLESLDGEVLTPYTGLSYPLTLEPKTILKTDEYLHASLPVSAEFSYSTPAGLQTFTSYIWLKGIDMIEEIPALVDDYEEGFTDIENDVSPLFRPPVTPGAGIYQLDINYKVRLEISVTMGNGTLDGCDPIDRFSDLTATLILRRKRLGAYEYYTIGTTSFTDCYNNTDNRFIEELVYTYSGIFPFPALGGEIITSDEVSLYLKVEVSGSYTKIDPGFDITFTVVDSVFDHGDSFFKVTLPTTFTATDADVFLVNEVLARTIESVTNNAMTMYSEYFGRTDSEPYNVYSDGCGGLAAVTSGLRIRRKTDSIFSVSFKEIYDGLNAIHNLGFGLELDTVKGDGSFWVRIEPNKYFYDPEVVLTCDRVPHLTRTVITDEHFSISEFGYLKWEAEEYNGLDEFNTKRKYRTSLTSVKNTHSKLSSLIASGYAIEITRQKYLGTSKDWRYDNDTFIICLQRGYAGALEVEQGNILSPANLIDPATVYNFRISPNRNALRHLNKTLASYPNPVTSDGLIFMSGEGNILAEGQLSDGCNVEATVLSESEESLKTSDMETPEDGTPVYRPELWEFDYPMSIQDYRDVKANPRGIVKVRYGQHTDFHECFIREIQYKPNEGIANFQLLPKLDLSDLEGEDFDGLDFESDFLTN